MTLLLSMLPLYVVGNLHCMGMCGPLVLMIGKHRYRYWYFVGRTLSFTLVAFLAGGFGSVLNVLLSEYHISAAASLAGGLVFTLYGIAKAAGWRWRFPLSPRISRLNQKLAGLMLEDTPRHTLIFGLATVLLPCGQTMIVFSACALSGSPLVGALNGVVFALMTSPALLLSMRMHRLLSFSRSYYEQLLGICSILVGVLAICRGMAEMGFIEHVVLIPQYHLVLY